MADNEKQWVCVVCGYVYDGDTPFEELPDDWTCPVCGVDKSFLNCAEQNPLPQGRGFIFALPAAGGKERQRPEQQMIRTAAVRTGFDPVQQNAAKINVKLPAAVEVLLFQPLPKHQQFPRFPRRQRRPGKVFLFQLQTFQPAADPAVENALIGRRKLPQIPVKAFQVPEKAHLTSGERSRLFFLSRQKKSKSFTQSNTLASLVPVVLPG